MAGKLLTEMPTAESERKSSRETRRELLLLIANLSLENELGARLGRGELCVLYKCFEGGAGQGMEAPELQSPSAGLCREISLNRTKGKLMSWERLFLSGMTTGKVSMILGTNLSPMFLYATLMKLTGSLKKE